ncbi:transcriptional regulator [Pannonibacter phragmitetus]|uniref:Transcriptional regulator n=2 Tax=Pannonibacter phragmitetus TaxID=121719 RepID=A0A0U3P0Q3_9HYPH|nr:transcriptional regulator [Pannonibacter phragmitetus]
MHRRHRTSLNAIRVFAVVARTSSLKAAAMELGVTSGAVSHQIKKLEVELGMSFFHRQSNAISLTPAGSRFHEEIAPAIETIERSVEALYRDENEISVQVSTSLALRWLIPSLDRFRALWPNARVQVDTGRAHNLLTAFQPHVVIRYFQRGEEVEGWSLLARDMRRPVVSPRLLSGRSCSIEHLPILQCTTANRDWALWCEKFGFSLADIPTAYAFDTDDAALHACTAGLGVVLAPPFLTAREIQSGSLAVVQGYEEAVESGQYGYQRRSEQKLVRQFCRWMEDEMREFA